eukprot:10343803-Ditylum_brightwellii.AAC.1
MSTAKASVHCTYVCPYQGFQHTLTGHVVLELLVGILVNLAYVRKTGVHADGAYLYDVLWDNLPGFLDLVST